MSRIKKFADLALKSFLIFIFGDLLSQIIHSEKNTVYNSFLVFLKKLRFKEKKSLFLGNMFKNQNLLRIEKIKNSLKACHIYRVSLNKSLITKLNIFNH